MILVILLTGRKTERRVSFVYYMEPSDVPKDDVKKLKQLYERSSGTSLTNSSFATPSKSTRPGHSSGRASTHSSGRKSSLSEERVRPKPSKSSQNSGHSSGHSEEKKAKKKHRTWDMLFVIFCIFIDLYDCFCGRNTWLFTRFGDPLGVLHIICIRFYWGHNYSYWKITIGLSVFWLGLIDLWSGSWL